MKQPISGHRGAAALGQQLFDIDMLCRQSLRYFFNNARSVIADQFQAQGAKFFRGFRKKDCSKGLFDYHLELCGTFRKLLQITHQGIGTAIINTDTQNAGKLSGQMRHITFQPVAMVACDHLRQ